LGQAWPVAQALLADLRQIPGVTAAEPAGSLRRMRATVGDLDLVAAAADPRPVMEVFTHHPQVSRVISNGESKSSVELHTGLRVQLWIQPPERFGTVLQYATGSKDHNVRLRELAQGKGYSLSEKGLQRLAEDRVGGTEQLFDKEESLYAALGLPWIPPELREDRGEIAAARAGRLPELITLADMQADLHNHTTWSDGAASIRAMAEAARSAGLRVLAITDHSSSLGIVGGMTAEDLPRQRVEIDAVQAELGDSLRILQGAEVEIHSDGSLDYPDEVLASLDFVIASLHVSLRQPRDQITARLIRAIQNPQVDLIGHPTGVLLPDREGADLDMEAVFSAAASNQVALEISADYHRLDLNDVYARLAIEKGALLSINCDAHAPAGIAQFFFGIATARRGWVTPASVINTWPVEKLLDWLTKRKTSS
jgi:DNA polymerase (family 10)